MIPHLDWVFVSHRLKRQGIAGALLERVVRGLCAAGYHDLASTCLTDNAASLLWHWRNGFAATSRGFRLGHVTRISDPRPE